MNLGFIFLCLKCGFNFRLRHLSCISVLCVWGLFASVCTAAESLPHSDSLANEAIIRVEVLQAKREQRNGEKFLVTPLKISNVGTRYLVILEIKKDCQCASVNYSKNAVAPGESLDVSVAIKNSKVGNLKESLICIISNDPKNGEFLVKIPLRD